MLSPTLTTPILRTLSQQTDRLDSFHIRSMRIVTSVALGDATQRQSWWSLGVTSYGLP
jgi:hypothetical protein